MVHVLTPEGEDGKYVVWESEIIGGGGNNKIFQYCIDQ